MKLIIAGNMSSKIISALQKLNYQLFFTKANPNVHEAIAYHPDTQAAKVDGCVVCDTLVYDTYKDFFGDADTRLVCGDTKIQCNYPYDVAYNIKVVGEYVFHNFAFTDPVLKGSLSDKKLIDVKQGYSGCSICKVSDNAIISADVSIHRKAVSSGLNSLLVSPGSVSLPGFDYGFIGGASFLCGDTLYFFGDVTGHNDYNSIKNFCEQNGTRIVSLSDEKLTDYGGAITFD